MKGEQFTDEKKKEIITKCVEVCHKEGLHIGQCREIFKEAYQCNHWFCYIWDIVVMKHVREELQPIKQEIEITFPVEFVDLITKEIEMLKAQVAELSKPETIDAEQIMQGILNFAKAMDEQGHKA